MVAGGMISYLVVGFVLSTVIWRLLSKDDPPWGVVLVMMIWTMFMWPVVLALFGVLLLVAFW